MNIKNWIIDNVLDHTIDTAIGDNKISNPLADEIQKLVTVKATSGGELSNELLKMFDKEVNVELSMGKDFNDILEDPEFLETLIGNMSFKIIERLNLSQVIAKAAAREQRGYKQEDILKGVKAEITDTPGYTADSYKSFDSLCESIMKNLDK